MLTRKHSIAVTEGENISAVLSLPESSSGQALKTVLIAHGAGGNMDNEFIVAMAEGLAEAGMATLRFNFLYAEKGRKAPDSPKKLNAAWLAVSDWIKTCSYFSVGPVYAAGKSMGGRYASQLLAEGLLDAEALILYGYPLHAPGKKDRLRDEHLYKIGIPMLFIEGTRDSLCDLEKLEGVLKRIKSPWSLEIIEGGDHSFRVPKALGLSSEQVNADILQRTLAWIEGL